jgi:RNA recognition motif-containing protein
MTKEDDYCVFINQIPDDLLTEDKLSDIFKKYGKNKVEIQRDKKTGKPLKFGFVTFDKKENYDKVFAAQNEVLLMFLYHTI